MKKALAALLYVLIVFLPTYAQKPIRDLKPTVILVSLDGVHPDYLERYQPETLNRLARDGVRARWMIPAFPTKTFPNHYTVATGLYSENHGIIENNIYDFGTTFSLGKREEVQNARWWLGEPIWVTAERQGQKAGAYFFPGTEAAIGGVRPTFWRTYNGRVPPEMRVDKLLQWLDLPAARRPTMMTLYFSDVDDAGHEFSPDAEETKHAVWNVDRYLKRLMDGLRARGVDQTVNVIVVSDHGMATVDYRNATFLDDYFDFKLTERILWTNEIVQIFPKPGKAEEIYARIKNLPRATCWRKREIPARLRYRASPRIAPIVCSSAEGWLTTSRERHKDLLADADDPARPRGSHGYDNLLPSMRAIFVAHGAAFKKGKIIEPFENVNVYNVMARVLNLKPAPNDGDLETARQALR